MVDVKQIDALLPQTQCRECGYDGCFPYAEALAQGTTTIDKCPPGGPETLNALGKLLNINPAPLMATGDFKTRHPSIAVIQEEECIGCTKCIQACPVDAIVGAAKLMHVILTQECTGCGLCVEPCPMDCITMQSIEQPLYQQDKARVRFQARQARLLRDREKKHLHYRQKKQILQQTDSQHHNETQAKQSYILEALARVNAKKQPQ